MDHQGRLARWINETVREYRRDYPELTQFEAQDALCDAISDLDETVPDEIDAVAAE